MKDSRGIKMLRGNGLCWAVGHETFFQGAEEERQ